MYKVLIVGCGKVAGYFDDLKNTEQNESHLSAFRSNSSFEVAGCVDIDRDKAEEFSCKSGIPYSGDDLSDAISNVGPDVVLITTPDETHFAVTSKLLTLPSPLPRLVLLEKPACSSENELNILRRMADDRNVPVFVNHSRRFSQLYKKLRTGFKEDKFGALLRIDGTYYGGWRHSGVHLVDTIRYVSELELKNLLIVEKVCDGQSDDPTYTVKGELGPQKIPVWFHGWNQEHYQIFDFDFRFSGGRLRVSNFEEQVIWEEPHKNLMEESVLQPQSMGFPQTKESPLRSLACCIREYLDDNRSDMLEGCLLTEIAPTMRTLWQVENGLRNETN